MNHSIPNHLSTAFLRYQLRIIQQFFVFLNNKNMSYVTLEY